jgi:hypothetical protein
MGSLPIPVTKLKRACNTGPVYGRGGGERVDWEDRTLLLPHMNAQSPKTCLRCDWHGETEEPTCQNCGARPLYVVGASPSVETEDVADDRSKERSPGTVKAPRVDAPDIGAPPSDPPMAPTAPKASTRRSTRWAVAQVLAALALILTLGTWLSARDEGPAPPAAPEAPVSGASPTPAASASPAPRGNGLDEGILSPGRHSPIADGVSFSFRVPRWGWENHGDTYLSSSTPGGGVQDAEGIIYWTQISGGDHAHPCGQWWGSPLGSVANWAANAANPTGTKHVSGPTHVTVGGRAAERVVFRVRRDVACEPGFFYTWKRPDPGGASWKGSRVGDTVSVWILDVDGKRLFIEADVRPIADALQREIQQIVGSIHFE